MVWPEKLPGLDVAEGVGRLLNNRDIYQKVLECFLEDNRTFISQLQSVSDSEDLEESRRLIHALKGSAANISANALSELCLQFERQMLGGQQIERIQIAALEQALSEVQDSTQQLLDIKVSDLDKHSDFHVGEAFSRERLLELRELLQARDFMAQTLLQELKSAISNQFGEDVFDQLSTAVDQFDFASAEHQLKQLL